MRCPFCHHTVEPKNAWKGSADRFYCSEFCADSETIVPGFRQDQKAEIDRNYLQRLERLIPLRQSRIG